MALSLPPAARLVVATHNRGKAVELAALLDDRFDVISAAELGLPEPEEPETTFIGNAIIKARAAADRSGLIALADDSGLCVAGLEGAPGVHSARWAGPDRDFARAMARVQSRLDERPDADHAASFVCALAVAWPDGPVVAFEGRIAGEVSFPPRGTLGFGYDPIFIPTGETRTFGEMAPAEKDAISHRARAFAKLVDALLAA
ncbi:MAG: RdgB/HAM1 family non-canonical purine NTP pyrophosphatase [Alphaproteobacteria bacterium]|nr:RdgB/HAM1 family non-canonical purine NTP pyrophosphatase [Alphaproteobacteria bacterium]